MVPTPPVASTTSTISIGSRGDGVDGRERGDAG
jgi:hypothetical protein